MIIDGRDPGDFLGAASSTAGAFFANSLSSGDLDGDDIHDVALGSSAGDGPNNEREDAGEVYVLFGRRNWPGQIDLADERADVEIYEAEAGGTLSSEYGVYSADLNGDGAEELLLTAPHAHGPDEEPTDGVPNDRREVAGEAYLILGRERALWSQSRVIDLCFNVPAPSMNCPQWQQRLPGSGWADLIVFGADIADLLGKVIAGGDTDGDGFEDLIVSARWSESLRNSRENTGEAFVILGGGYLRIAPSLQTIIAVDTCIPGDIFPEEWNCQRQRVPNSRLPDVVLYAQEVGVGEVGDGAYFVEIADLTNDGLGEMVMTANWADGPGNQRVDAGELYLFLGRSLQGEQQEYLVRVLWTTWENNIFSDPPLARVQVLEGSPNGTPGEEREFAWIEGPEQAQRRCFRIWVGTEEFFGRLIENIQRYQEVPCDDTGAVSAQLEILPEGCGATFAVGQRATVVIRILSIDPFVFGQPQARFRLDDVLADGRVQTLFDRVLGEGTYPLPATITPPTGPETLILLVRMPNGQWQEEARCSFQVVSGPGAGQVLLTIQARTPQGEVSINMELFINPPAGGWRMITTPYQETWDQGTSILLQGPENFTQGGQEWQFDHWEVTRVTATGQTDTFILTQNPLEATLVSPQVTIVAVYVAGGG